ncbi:hypothetical protein PG990_000563 [Apiospora arundinis]|jgi:hypothetical protein|uniref:Uncharacterized protein n=1 Tax=Apiospora arundinis TaxID=335852 RepID=A0ABR2HZT2_9PEZI
MGLLEKIQAKIEIYRLEQRYTRNRNRRSTFISNAVYVDGEYVYQTPNTTGSSTNSSAVSSPVEQYNRHSVEDPRSPTHVLESQTPAQKKKLNRFSSMPGFGSLSKASSRDLRNNAVDVHEVR